MYCVYFYYHSIRKFRNRSPSLCMYTSVRLLHVTVAQVTRTRLRWKSEHMGNVFGLHAATCWRLNAPSPERNFQQFRIPLLLCTASTNVRYVDVPFLCIPSAAVDRCRCKRTLLDLICLFDLNICGLCSFNSRNASSPRASALASSCRRWARSYIWYSDR
jgi:hypothetical protein